ncbi:MAG TPA: glycosyltransferase [Acidimicrobiales bacterium]|nr:glycosyltransferase [Acidimicrobiales bacterium]
MARTEPVALVHDYLTQRGGAERAVLAMSRAFPRAPLYTSLYDPAGTFPEFADADVRPSRLDRVPGLRRHHRAALPLLARTFSSMAVDADVSVCSSSGWAHGVVTSGRKVVYCYAPARWLYQTDRYLGTRAIAAGPQRALKRAALGAFRKHLERWDRAAAASADRYLVVSTASAEAVRELYGLEAEVLAPPPAIDANGPRRPVPGLDPGYWLCVSRLLPYKNLDLVIEAVQATPDARLVVVGEGPERARLETLAGPRATFLRGLGDDQLRWCYANCTALITASYEDFGLTPLEAAAFGKPTAAPRLGGFLDTIVDGRTGVLFERPDAGLIAEAMNRVGEITWAGEVMAEHAAGFSEARFAGRLAEVVAEEAAKLG